MARPKPQDYMTEEVLTRIRGWAMDGLTEEQIAENLGISVMSLSRWKRDKNADDGLSLIGRALKTSKEIADRNVESALYKSAMGFEYEEITEERKFNPITQTFEMVVTKVVHKKMLPQTTAQIFWLKNRKPQEWRERREIEDRVEFENDGFIDALKGQAKDTFSDPESSVEE